MQEDATLKTEDRRNGMPTVIVEGPQLSLERTRTLVESITETVSGIYDWPAERIIIIIRENNDENVARGGVLIADSKNG